MAWTSCLIRSNFSIFEFRLEDAASSAALFGVEGRLLGWLASTCNISICSLRPVGLAISKYGVNITRRSSEPCKVGRQIIKEEPLNMINTEPRNLIQDKARLTPRPRLANL